MNLEHVLDRLAAIAESAPDHIAVVESGRDHTISELLERASAIADEVRNLTASSVEPVIAVAAHPSFNRVAAMLGIWAAGGVYVPVDPDPEAPIERLQAIFEIAAPVLAIHDSDALRLLDHPATAATERLPIDGDFEKAQSNVRSWPLSRLAYVVFTSGSTGEPKGVALEHATVSRLLKTTGSRVRSGLRTLQLAPVMFDMAIKEVLVTLAGSGTLIVEHGVDRRDPENVLSFIRKTDADTVFLTPTGFQGLSLLPEFSQQLESRDLTVICGGEQLTIDGAMAANPRLHLDNHYGPTETHVVAAHRVRSSERGSIPIGVALPGLDLYVLDDQLREVSEGLAGEIWIAGEGLARGYLARPALTADRFLPDPFSMVSGHRMYRTGDIGRVLPNGEITLIGRADDQVKIRGYRVEPSEISAVLTSHPAVRAAHVAGRRLGSGETVTLVAWLQGEWAYDDNLRGFLARSLPPFMVPAHFIWVDEFPVTRNGKVDSRRLPLPGTRRPSTGNRYVEPASEIERQFAEIWASELGLEQVGRDDNFFDLGGYSLQAVRLVFRLRNELGIEMPVHALYEAPTIAMLTSHSSVSAPSAMKSVVRSEGSDYLPSFGQSRMWLYQTAHPTSSTYNLPLVMRIRGAFDANRFERAIQETVRQNEILRTCIVAAEDGLPRQRILPNIVVPLITIAGEGQTLDDRLTSVIRTAEAAARIPFDLTRAPLIRSYLIALDKDDHVIILVAHHVVLDGWSSDLFAREVSAAYSADVGHTTVLPPSTSQYLDFTMWQRERIDVRGETASVDYWRNQLQGAWETPLIESAGHGTQDANGKLTRFRIDVDTASELSRIATTHGTTNFVLALALYQRALQKWSQNSDIRVGVPVSGRTHAETARMIGFFSNTVVIRSQLQEGEPFLASLDRAKQTVNDAFLHQEVPYELVVEACNPPRAANDDGRLFQASMAFAHGGHQASEWNFGGASPEFLPIAPKGTQFPLILFVDWGSSTKDVELRLLWNERMVSSSAVQSLMTTFDAVVQNAVDDAQEVETPIQAAPTTLIDAFARAVRDWPDRAFIESADGSSLSYHDANAEVEALARGLNNSGIDRGDVVAVDLPRGAEQIVGLLGVMRAGAVYLPLDYSLPSARRDAMLRDAGARAFISGSHDLPHSPVASYHIEELQAQDGSLPDLPREVDSAYALFTSGSTGRPKAVMVPHAGPASLLRGQEALRIVLGSRILGFASPTFDASIWELLMALGCAGTLVFAEAGTRIDPVELCHSLSKRRLDVCLLTPTVLRMMPQEMVWRGILISGGEALDATLASKLRQFIEAGKLWNAYGPTEASVVTTLRRVSAQDVSSTAGNSSATVPIGRPVLAAQTKVMDPSWQEVIGGDAGELWVTGDLVSNGYIGRPALTAEKFAPAPGGKRTYRTGDRVRVRVESDSSLEYLGRLDEQVKVAGQRIELGEVEAVLRRHPNLLDAVVTLQSRPERAELFALYVSTQGDIPALELRTLLRTYLPEVMVPREFRSIPMLPTLQSGKVDRSAALRLAAEDEDIRSGESLSASAQSTAEGVNAAPLLALRDSWSSILLGQHVEANSNFFDLGGSSLEIVRVAKSSSHVLQRPISVRQVMENQSPLALLTSLDEGSKLTSLTVLRANPEAGARVVLIPPLNNSIKCYASLVDQLSELHDVQVEAFDLERQVFTTLAQTAAVIADELYNRDDRRPIWLTGWSIAAPLAFAIARQLDQRGCSSGAFLFDGYMPGAQEYELGAYVLADKLETLECDLVEPLPRWLQLAGITSADLRRAERGNWHEVIGRWASNVRAVGSFVPDGALAESELVLARKGKSVDELTLMIARWRSISPDVEMTLVDTSHQLLLQDAVEELVSVIRRRCAEATALTTGGHSSLQTKGNITREV